MTNWSSDHGPWGLPGRTPAQATPPVASANWVYDNPNYAQIYPQAPMPTEYAFWGRRVVASLVDSTVALPYLVSYSAMAATIDYGTYNSRTGVLSGGHGPSDKTTSHTGSQAVCVVAWPTEAGAARRGPVRRTRTS